jgi:hypothetical protein
LITRRDEVGGPRGGATASTRLRLVQQQPRQPQAEQEAGNDPGRDQMRDRDRAAGGERVDHRVGRRRDEQRLVRSRNRYIVVLTAKAAGANARGSRLAAVARGRGAIVRRWTEPVSDDDGISDARDTRGVIIMREALAQGQPSISVTEDCCYLLRLLSDPSATP